MYTRPPLCILCIPSLIGGVLFSGCPHQKSGGPKLRSETPSVIRGGSAGDTGTASNYWRECIGLIPSRSLPEHGASRLSAEVAAIPIRKRNHCAMTNHHQWRALRATPLSRTV
jgi:hypothetical protein